MSWYEQWFGSPYYSILYEHRDEAEAREFVEALLSYLQPVPGCTMLDIACGEGRFARQLAGHGFDVTGIDISTESIAAAKATENDRLHFFVHDMRQPFYINYFDFTFNFFTSFGYFEHKRDHENAAHSFAASLKPGGILVIDYLNMAYARKHMITEATIERGAYTFHIRKQLTGGYFTKEIRFTDAEGEERTFTERVAAFSAADFEKMLRPAGMVPVTMFGNYRLAPYHQEESPRLIMIFKKEHA